MAAVDLVYSLSRLLPAREQYILISQMLRSAISIPSNIAEGYGRSHRAEFIQFLSIAQGSATELETQMIIAQRQYDKVPFDFEKFLQLLEEVQKMLFVMKKKLKN